MNCPLCQSSETTSAGTDHQREYYHCGNCDLRSVPSRFFVGPEDEKERYALHDNTPGNDDYITYLESVAADIQKIDIAEPAMLDFGCGENAVLTDILVKKGYDCNAYDPLYEIGIDTLDHKYDIIILCEVLEHMREPARAMDMIKNLLNKNGALYLKTQLVTAESEFLDWWYKEDLTHINFYSFVTIEYLKNIFNKEIIYTDYKSVTILG